MIKTIDNEWRLRGNDQIRYAGGVDWLLDMNQNDIKYEKPMMLSEAVAYLYHLILENIDLKQVKENFIHKYEVELEQADRDIEAFYLLLEQYGVIQKETMEI